MKLFLDSSAFAKRFVEESGSQEVEKLCSQATELGLSILCVPEVISALNRRLREKALSQQDYLHAKQRFAHEIRDVVVIHLTEDVIQGCIELLEANPLRAMDALHVACAMAWAGDLFVSSDHRQITAAKGVGLRTRQV
jgi:predicted nucleic acid-binding protein